LKRTSNLQIQVINGPNLNLLGERELHLYGKQNLKEIEKWTAKYCKALPVKIQWFQSNSEEKIINLIHQIKKGKSVDFLVINPAGLSHTSVVLLDALLSLDIPIAEVHLTNPYRREEFRHHLLTAKAASLIMGGLGYKVYGFAIHALLEMRE